ncbi:hypothetical protein DL768_007161 [Monosporascus sp. mg162]|nr:hypothetical protein DL768_007161 [Monosporascus sp. mg162]
MMVRMQASETRKRPQSKRNIPPRLMAMRPMRTTKLQPSTRKAKLSQTTERMPKLKEYGAVDQYNEGVDGQTAEEEERTRAHQDNEEAYVDNSTEEEPAEEEQPAYVEEEPETQTASDQYQVSESQDYESEGNNEAQGDEYERGNAVQGEFETSGGGENDSYGYNPRDTGYESFRDGPRGQETVELGYERSW